MRRGVKREHEQGREGRGDGGEHSCDGGRDGVEVGMWW